MVGKTKLRMDGRNSTKAVLLLTKRRPKPVGTLVTIRVRMSERVIPRQPGID